MSEINLKKLLTSKKLVSIVREFIGNESIAITDNLENLIVGEIPEDAKVERFPIELDEKVLVGWIIGDKKIKNLIPIITCIINQEIEKKNLAQEVLSKYKEINLFYRLSEKIASVLELEVLVNLVLEEAKKLIKATSGSIMLFKNKTAMLEIVSSFGSEAYNSPVIPGQGIAGYIFATGKAEIVNDVSSDSRFVPGKIPISSVICAPLKTRDKVIGIINFSNVDPIIYTAADLQLFSVLAGQAAKAIENAILYTEKEEHARTLEQKIQDLKQAQIQLVQAEKMSSLGQLVAGIAHEINNPVNFIHGNLAYMQRHAHNLLGCMQLYQKYYPDPEPEIQAEIEKFDMEFIRDDLPKMLGSMKIGTDRIRQIVLSLRNFSRMDEAYFKAVDIHDGIDSTLLILQHRLKETSARPAIQVIRNYGILPMVECYPSQLNQAFMNILANAIDALEETNIKRTYKEIEKNPNQITIQTSITSSKWVKIAISDNGMGVSDSIRKCIFNPFFTTKPIGKGTGMGMSISYQIVTEKHGGKLDCFSILGKGTEFIIQIPVQRHVCNEV